MQRRKIGQATLRLNRPDGRSLEIRVPIEYSVITEIDPGTVYEVYLEDDGRLIYEPQTISTGRKR